MYDFSMNSSLNSCQASIDKVSILSIISNVMTVEALQTLDLIELAHRNRAERERLPQIRQTSKEIIARLNRIFEETKWRKLITQEPVHEATQFSVAGEEPIEVIIYTMKDTKWDRSISGATCFGISLRTQVKDWKLL